MFTSKDVSTLTVTYSALLCFATSVTKPNTPGLQSLRNVYFFANSKKRLGSPNGQQRVPLSARLLFSGSVAAEPQRLLFEVEIGMVAQRWDGVNEFLRSEEPPDFGRAVDFALPS